MPELPLQLDGIAAHHLAAGRRGKKQGMRCTAAMSSASKDKPAMQ